MYHFLELIGLNFQDLKRTLQILSNFTALGPVRLKCMD